jgi:outer membrane lipoprotein SlyB
VEQLRSIGIEKDHLNLLTPGARADAIDQVPTTDTEQPGMGSALGAVVGGVLGGAGGVMLGTTLATLFLPGVGPVLVAGWAAAALAGAGGAVGGAVAGKALEDAMARGLPIDELFIYEDALRQGRSIVIAFAKDEKQANEAREILKAASAEAIDVARKNWWVGIGESDDYEVPEDNAEDARHYRAGFEAALHPGLRGRSYEEAAGRLKQTYPAEHSHKKFREGFMRGQAHYKHLLSEHPQ